MGNVKRGRAHFDAGKKMGENERKVLTNGTGFANICKHSNEPPFFEGFEIGT